MNTPSAAVTCMEPIQALTLWKDTALRSGEESMAADELLLSLGGSWLRTYHWKEPTVTYGFFDTEGEAQRLFPEAGIRFVRRWTGGGIVDHRRDVPFTLVLAREDKPERPSSAELYRWIHGRLACVFQTLGLECRLLSADAPGGGRSCWASPVTSDLVDASSRKLAGGGQRRTPRGVLHQGSIQGCTPPGGWDELFARRLACGVRVIEADAPVPDFQNRVAALCREKYASAAWRDASRGRRRHS